MPFARTGCFALAFASALGSLPPASAQTIAVADVVELSGGGASNGVNWRQGLELAAEEINARGGILGQKIELSHFDTQTNAGMSRAMVQKALDAKPLVVMGPIYSGSAKVDMALTQQAEVPEFVGAQLGSLTAAGDDYLFRANISQDLGMARISDYIHNVLKVKKIAIVWVNNDFGKGGHDILIHNMADRQIAVVADRPIDYGSLDFTADLLKVKDSGADLIFPYMTAEDTARFIMAYRKQGLTTPLVGETTLLQQNVLDIVGNAANGAISHLSLTSEAPGAELKAFGQRFQARFGKVPDHNAISSYAALYAVKATAERIGKLDSKSIAAALHGQTITVAQEPGILLDSSWDARGELSRESYLGQAVDGKLKIIDTFH
jgi:branched-chain amino acid transport system substrate-binding protein